MHAHVHVAERNWCGPSASRAPADDELGKRNGRGRPLLSREPVGGGRLRREQANGARGAGEEVQVEGENSKDARANMRYSKIYDTAFDLKCGSRFEVLYSHQY